MNARTRTDTATILAAQPAAGGITGHLTAIFLMATGWGWNAGNFVQPLNTSWGPMADLLHVLPLAILLPLGVRFISAAAHGVRASGARNGITVLACIGIIGCVVMIILGATNPDPNSVGVHTAEDWMPVIVLNAGTLLWLAALLLQRRNMRPATTAERAAA
jgi:hypothetical protein